MSPASSTLQTCVCGCACVSVCMCVWVHAISCHINHWLRWIGEKTEQTSSYPLNLTTHWIWAEQRKSTLFFFLLLRQNQRHASVCDTDNELGDTNYSFQESENRTESFILLFLWSEWLRGTKKERTPFPVFKVVVVVSTDTCLPGEHTTAGCGSDPCHDIISKGWGSSVTGLNLGDLPLTVS